MGRNDGWRKFGLYSKNLDQRIVQDTDVIIDQDALIRRTASSHDTDEGEVPIHSENQPEQFCTKKRRLGFLTR